MGRRILIIPDKFKGTMTAAQAAHAIAAGWRRVHPGDVATCLPMSDGGDGFGEVMGGLLGAERLKLRTVDAAHRPCVAFWWWIEASRTAIIESATVVGLAQLPKGRFHPFELDTFGLGAVLRAARRRRAETCLIGIGGSATNDGGFGLARALGWKFKNCSGQTIRHWPNLAALAEISGQVPAWFREVRVVADVGNPLCGKHGASRVYGPQKGLRPEDMRQAEACLRSLARRVKAHQTHDFARWRGSGAAGGLGFGLRAFLGARLERGFDLFARYARLRDHLQSADLVSTGEGSLDASSLMGKGVGRLAADCQKLGVPCLGLAGQISPEARASGLLAHTWALTTLTDCANALRDPELWLAKTAERAGREWD